MTISIITIDGVDFESYASVAEADAYLIADISNTTWTFKDGDTKGQALVSATRILNTLSWCGAKTVSTQTNAFPRTGLTDKDGVALSTTDIPLAINHATTLLAGALAKTPNIADNKTSSDKKRVKAGPVEVEFYADATESKLSNKLPQSVVDTIGFLIGCGSSNDVALASGPIRCSIVPEEGEVGNPFDTDIL